jgi:uncharacterized circularly permuted ATP-grasp superfamily protein/uncharacterized alpha-E superfamily protein
MAPAQDDARARTDGGIESMLAGYRPLPGIFDEMMGNDGLLRAHWRPFLTMLAELGTAEIQRRFAATDRHLRDSGVFYRVYEDPAGVERPWPFSHMPVVIDSADWMELKAGLVQRAELIEAVLADVYGDATLTRDGRLPAALIAGNPEFLRPLVGVAPPGDAHLRFYAVDVGRSASGHWWVLADRAQAPSGAGYALENRLALVRGIPEIYRAIGVNRVAPFFAAFQSELSSLNRQDDSRVCLLTPGPMNEAYFEHAYLARYLGFLLVEGEDLTVRDDGVFIRTVSGLRRAEVLLRRLDADFADPLELNAKSRLGVPGLVQAVRDGKVVIANSLGAGVIEARAWLAFLPALAPAVLGTELKLPNVATWWLGQSDVRREMAGDLHSMVIAAAFGTDAAGEFLGDGLLGATLDDAQRNRIATAIQDRGIDFVVQEAVHLSTTPAWVDGHLEPRPFILRVFLAKTGSGWSVMPGGFVRIADDRDARAVHLQQGGRTADAWVLSEGPVAEVTLLPTPERMTIKRATGMLPSRAAENLFWVGRYVERAEATLRLVRALLNRISDAAASSDAITGRIAALLGAWSAGPTDVPYAKALLFGRAALQRDNFDGALPSLVGAARSAGSVIRDRLSPDAWRALTRLGEVIGAPWPAVPSESDMFDRVEAGLSILSSFSGLAQENMTQLGGWRFLELGRRIERAIAACRFVRQFAPHPTTDDSLDVLLELCDSQITYRQRYVMVGARAPVIDLVVLDPSNPRSLAYQIDRIETHLAALPTHEAGSRLTPPQQITASLATILRTTEASAIDDSLILNAEDSLLKLSEAISSSYLNQIQRSEVMWETLA